MTQEEIDAVLKSTMSDMRMSDMRMSDMRQENPVFGEDIQDIQRHAPTDADPANSKAKPKSDSPPKSNTNSTERTDRDSLNNRDQETGSSPKTVSNIDFLLDVPLNVSVELGRAKIAISDMLQLGPGSVIELDKLIGEPVDLLINDKLIARGEVVVFDENFGIRITDIINPEDRIRSLR